MSRLCVCSEFLNTLNEILLMDCWFIISYIIFIRSVYGKFCETDYLDACTL